MTIKKKTNRKDRETEVLIGLIDLFLQLRKPIGSHTLKENGFDHLSPATIRNYFARLETEGFLKQHHISGGRTPTDKGFRLYAKKALSKCKVAKDDDTFLASILFKEGKELSSYFQKTVEALSELTECAVFISSPRFDQDFISDIKLVRIDSMRVLAIIISDFSLVHTETIYLPKKLGHFSLKRIEEYFQFRLTGLNRPVLSPEEEEFAKQNYNELILRHFIQQTQNEKACIYRGGLAKLLRHPSFHDPLVLSNTLSLFENEQSMQNILQKSLEKEHPHFWIGDDLQKHIGPPHHAAMVTIPYKMHNKKVGTIAIMGPTAMNYKKIFGILQKASAYLSKNLTKIMYKFKLTYRQPKTQAIGLQQDTAEVIGLSYQKNTSENNYE